MEQQKVDMFIMTNGKFFPEDKVMFIRERLLSLDESKAILLMSMQFKDLMTALIISLFLGCYGVDRFYVGDTGVGILKLITCGGCGIWAIIDWFLIMGTTREKNYNRLLSVI
ncbi:MAG: TM2 domain-containing protein [Bacteroidaceae bacterium]|nr:TM2 domain-containing protein [Bacteroidaceae bacterium]